MVQDLKIRKADLQINKLKLNNYDTSKILSGKQRAK